MISFQHVKPLVSMYRLACDECHKAHDVVVDERQAEASGGLEAMLAALEPYERAALSREGCPHAVPPPPEPETPPAEPEPSPA